MIFSTAILTIILTINFTSAADEKYVVPDPKITVLKKGFEVTIPNENGITVFAFHGTINKPIMPVEAGQFSVDVNKKDKNKNWTYKNKDFKLKEGDVIHYWLFVIKDGIGYTYPNGQYTVPKQPYVVPKPKITILKKGFKVSVPHKDGIQLFAFHGNLNKPLENLEAGEFSVDINKKDNKNNWVYKNDATELKQGDTINYWLLVIKDNIGYHYNNGTYIVK